MHTHHSTHFQLKANVNFSHPIDIIVAAHQNGARYTRKDLFRNTEQCGCS